METNPEEVRAGQLWFLIAGGLGVILTVVLFRIDHMLSTSTAELEKGKMLNELRLAQSTLGGGPLDTRVAKTFLEKNEPRSEDAYKGEFHPRVDALARPGNPGSNVPHEQHGADAHH